jgi:hypothetical protein
MPITTKSLRKMAQIPNTKTIKRKNIGVVWQEPGQNTVMRSTVYIYIYIFSNNNQHQNIFTFSLFISHHQ